MTNGSQLHARIEQIFRDKLNIEVPSAETDIIESAVIDSLAFVDLLLYLEQEFDRKISLDDLEVDNFRSIASIAEFLSAPAPVTHAASRQAGVSGYSSSQP